jgi:hypothetical protein
MKAPWSLIGFISFLLFSVFVFWGWYNAEKRAHQLEIGPYLEDAQKKHLNEIEETIKHWKDVIITPEIYVFNPSTSSQLNSIESQPLFCCLKKHLPYSILWQDYANWKSKIQEYLTISDKLRNQIHGAWKIDDVEQTPAFEQVILALIANRANELKYTINYETNYPTELKYQSLNANGITVLTGKEMGKHWDFYKHEQCVNMVLASEYQKIADYYLQSETATKALHLHDSLKQLEDRIQLKLRDILLRRDWVVPQCRLCPKSEPTTHKED